MRTLAATAAFVCANADETSLMQDLVTRSSSSNKLEVGTSRKDSASKLLDTAVNMVKNGVTPDVITFVDATNADINESVLQAIKDEHQLDQNYIDDLCEQFTTAVQLLKDEMDTIKSHSDNRESTQQNHHDCRAKEATACAYSRRCEAQLLEKWDIVKSEERQMREYHTRIKGGWCVTEHEKSDKYGVWHNWQSETDWLSRQFDGSFWAETSPYPALDTPTVVRQFRDDTVTWFDEYKEQKIVVERAWEVYNAKVVECSGLERDWEAVIPHCDQAQTEAAGYACDHARTTRKSRNEFGRKWATLTHSFEIAEKAKLEAQELRKGEWETLKIVQCLLDHVHSAVIESIETGAPCPTLDSDPDTVTLTIEDCHIVTRGCDDDSMTKHLCLNWCKVPDVPELPELEPVACTPAFVAREQAHFSATLQGQYNDQLSNTASFYLDGETYGPYTEESDKLTHLLTMFSTTLSPAGWAGCAPPLMCIDCPEVVPQEPCGSMEEEARVCHVHEEYLMAGQGNADTFKCLDGTCISVSGRCNIEANCLDGSDEQNCGDVPVSGFLGMEFANPEEFDSEIHFQCADGTHTIEKKGLCNDFANCQDQSDEADCSKPLKDHVTVEASSGRKTSLEILSKGMGVFHDRSYEFDELGWFEGKTFVKYSNDDKTIDEAHVMLKIRTLKIVTVSIVALSKSLAWPEMQGYSQHPGLQGVEFSGVRNTLHKEWDTALLGDDSFSTSAVWTKSFPAGTISIPGNAKVGEESSDMFQIGGSFLIFIE